jgi:hypothetical protein
MTQQTHAQAELVSGALRVGRAAGALLAATGAFVFAAAVAALLGGVERLTLVDAVQTAAAFGLVPAAIGYARPELTPWAVGGFALIGLAYALTA